MLFAGLAVPCSVSALSHGAGEVLWLLQQEALPGSTGRGPGSSVSVPPVWSLQESGESYLEKARKTYSQMYSTREKVRAALRWGSGVLLVQTSWWSSAAEPALGALCGLGMGVMSPGIHWGQQEGVDGRGREPKGWGGAASTCQRPDLGA